MLIEILTTQMCVAVRGFDFEHASVHLENGNVEGASTQVIHSNSLAILFLIHAIGQSGSSRLVDDTENLQSRNFTRILGCLTLRVIEVGRNGYNRLGHSASQMALCRFLHFRQHIRPDLAGRELLSILRSNPRVPIGCFHDFERTGLNILFQRRIGKVAADQALGGIESVFRICYSLTLSWLANQHRAIILKCNH
mmetsp:Transcript_51492/g.107558  ORF Transcript_51492/g.107558 Transcript_51492/m.107558 type:complete len:195 (+) Transcript_51492:1534-2118(+)